MMVTMRSSSSEVSSPALYEKRILSASLLLHAEPLRSPSLAASLRIVCERIS